MRVFGFAGRWAGAEDLPALRRHVELHSGAPPRPDGAAAINPVDYAAPHVFAANGLAVAFRGEPLWTGGPEKLLQVRDPAEAIAVAYRDAGKSFLDWLHGRFALCVLDERAGDVLLAIDRMGIEPLAYAVSSRGIVFGTSAESVARFPALRTELRPQALFDYFMFHMIPSPDTVYEAVQKLEPGTCVLFKDGALSVSRYWRPHFAEEHVADSSRLEAELHASLAAAVNGCHPDDCTGAFLSGGLDSSTVAGVLARVGGKPARTFSIGFGVDAYNELEYARIAARHFGFEAHEYHVKPEDVVTALPVIAAAYDEPFGNSSAVPTYFCAKIAAERGVTHLLAGDGGDELFGGNDRYGRQQVFEVYRRIPALVRRIVEPLADRIAPEHGITALRKFRSYIDQARIALPERFEYWNLMYRADLAQMLDPVFNSIIDPRASLALRNEVYGAAECRSLLNRMLFYDWHFTLADNDLRKVGTMCESAGVKVSYPMLDPRVIDLSLRVPPDLKMAGTELRTFYKRAMRAFLPREILEKEKHGFGLPFGVWLKTHAPLQDLIFSLLTQLKARRVVRAEFLDQLIREQRGGDASYFGYAIWDLAMLEAWLEAHSPRFTA